MERIMKKKFEEFSVEADKNGVMITQPGYSERPDSTVRLSVEQVDILLKWLKEAKEEISE
jgi:hypothetical protein